MPGFDEAVDHVAGAGGGEAEVVFQPAGRDRVAGTFGAHDERDPDTAAATVRAIGHTGRLVSSGALILCLAFIAPGGVPQTDVKILSTGLAAGIVIDATIIRGILAPVLVALLGHYNWVIPDRVARLLRVQRLRPTAASGRS